jgi:ABC-2 type transport system ATP-binding protein
VDDLTATANGTVFVRASNTAKLTSILTALHATVHEDNDRGLTISGLTSDEVGLAAFGAGVTILELTPQRASLEDVFMDLTAGAVEFEGAKSQAAE